MLNYTPHAIDDLLQIKALLQSKAPDEATAIAYVIDTMRGAQKFILPDHGSLIYDQTSVPEGLEISRIPYSKTLIEVPFPSNAGNGVDLMRSTRRIILAEEGVQERDTNIFREIGPLEVPNAIRISVVCWVDQERKWFLQPTGAVIPIGTRSITAIRPENDPYEDNRIGNIAFVFQAHPILPGLDAMARKSQGELIYQHSVSNDLGTEIRIVAEMLAVLGCKNVSTEIVSSPPKLVKARARGGREPLHDYHILTVGETSLSQSGGAYQPGDEYQVKQHLRRGHIRRLSATHRIWVNKTVVAAGSSRGETTKDYRVKPSKPTR